MAHYDHTYVVPGEPGPRRAATTDPVDRDVSSYPHELADSDFRTVGEIFSAGHQPRPQEGVRHPHGDARRRRPGPPGARALGRDGRRRHRGRPGRPPRRLPGLPARHRVAAGAPARLPAHRRPRHLDRRARCSRGRRRRRRGRSTRPAATGRWSCWRTSPASTAHRTRCATCSWSTAPRSAARSSTSTGPIVFCVISRYHGGAFVVFSKALNPQMTVLAVEGSFASVIGGAPAAAVVFAGEVDKRAARRPAGPGAGGAGGRGRAAPSGPSSAPSWPSCARRCGRRSSRGRRRVRRACTASSARSRSGSVDAVIAASELRPRLVAGIEAGL